MGYSVEYKICNVNQKYKFKVDIAYANYGYTVPLATLPSKPWKCTDKRQYYDNQRKASCNNTCYSEIFLR